MSALDWSALFVLYALGAFCLGYSSAKHWFLGESGQRLLSAQTCSITSRVAVLALGATPVKVVITPLSLREALFHLERVDVVRRASPGECRSVG